MDKAPHRFNNNRASPLHPREYRSAIFFHPDYTVGTGISPIQSRSTFCKVIPRVAGYNRRSGIAPQREVHLALKITLSLPRDRP